MSIKAKNLAETLQFGVLKSASKVFPRNSEEGENFQGTRTIEFGSWNNNNIAAGSGEPNEQPPFFRNMNSFGMPLKDKNHAGQGGTDSHPYLFESALDQVSTEKWNPVTFAICSGNL